MPTIRIEILGRVKEYHTAGPQSFVSRPKRRIKAPVFHTAGPQSFVSRPKRRIKAAVRKVVRSRRKKS